MPYTIYVITKGPSDFPGYFVLRRHVADRNGNLVPDQEPLATTRSLEGAQKFLPPGLERQTLLSQDDPVIVEWWIDALS
jgi:hypothetical protein